MTKISKQNIRFKTKRLVSKLTISKRIKMAICDENCSSSSEEDRLPMLPPSSSDESDSELFLTEETHNETSESSLSESSSSKYASSFLASSLPSISSISEVSSYKNLHDEYVTPTENEYCPKTDSDNTIGECSRPQNTRKRKMQEMKKGSSLSRAGMSDQQAKTELKNGQQQKNQNEIKNDSKHVVHHREQTRQEYHESTVVEVNEDIPFEVALNNLSDIIRNNENNNSNPDINGIIQSDNMNFFSMITEMVGLNRNKTFVFLMMNLSLIAANINQLKHIIYSPDRSILFYISIGLLIASTFFQILAKICSVVTWGNHDVDYSQHIKKMKCLHKFTTFFTIIIVIINISLTGVTFAEFIKDLHLFD